MASTESLKSQFLPSPQTDHAIQTLLSTLATSRHTFLEPTKDLQLSSVQIAKSILDPLASDVHNVQLNRRNAPRKRKRESGYGEHTAVLGVKRIHTDGFGVQQIWAQAKLVLDAAREEVGSALEDLEARQVPSDSEAGSQLDNDVAGDDLQDENSEASTDGLDAEDGLNGFGGSDDDLLEENGYSEGEDDDDDDDEEEEEDASSESGGAFVADPNGLNDGFFSIDDFNRQTQFLEKRDQKGDVDDDDNSDEEVIDWDADPLTAPSSSKPKDGLDDDSTDEDDGPTFGNVDLTAPEGESEGEDWSDEEGGVELDGIDAPDNMDNIMYADFFGPPAKKASKKRDAPRKQPKKPNPGRELETLDRPEDDVEGMMADVQHDIFSDSGAEDSLSEADAADPKSRRSNHERRQAKLAEEIRRLEAASITKREWMLQGEAQAADRGHDSLLDQDLDFEVAGKPVPLATEQAEEDIRALIIRRILAREFDELIRRRPDDLSRLNARKERHEVDGTKPKQGLADEYEQGYLKRTDPNHVDERSEKLKRQHAEIEEMWRDVSGKLDALCSLTGRPKRPSESLEIRVNVPAILMEDARPSTGAADGSASRLAPQELYKAGDDAAQGEVVSRGGLPVAKEEMTQEDKASRRRRAREKGRGAKAASEAKKGGKSAAAKEKESAIGDLRKGGVRVIGQKGELRDADGNLVDAAGRSVSGSNFKL